MLGLAADDNDPLEDQLSQFRNKLINEEGYRPKAYLDSKGILSVGIGHKVTPDDKITLGQTITDDQIDQFFRADANPALEKARQQAAGIGITDPTFIPALASVNYQLGPNWNQKFPKTWAAMSSGDYQNAAMEAGRSNWMQQTPKRVRAFQDALLALPQKAVEPPD